MGKKITLNSPQFRVVLAEGDIDDDSTWVLLEVQSLTRDFAAAELTFKQRKWGVPSEQGMKFTSVIAYHALRRTRQIEGSWDEFEAGLVEVTSPDEDDEVDPTQPGPEPG